jgi:hypothetical protein
MPATQAGVNVAIERGGAHAAGSAAKPSPGNRNLVCCRLSRLPRRSGRSAHRFGQVERKTLSRRKCRCRRGCCSSRVTSAREHYELAGFAEKREGAFIPDEWDEAAYLKANPDVAEVSGACSKAHVLVFSTLSGLVGSMPLHKVPYMPF